MSKECYDKAQLLWTRFNEEEPIGMRRERKRGRKRKANMMTNQTLFKRIDHGAQVPFNSFIEEYTIDHTQPSPV